MSYLVEKVIKSEKLTFPKPIVHSGGNDQEATRQLGKSGEDLKSEMKF